MVGVPVTEWKLQKAQEEYPEAVARLEAQLSSSESGWIAGDEISMADVYAAAVIFQTRFMPFDTAPYPKMNAWVERVLALPTLSEYFVGVEAKFIAFRDSKKSQ